MEEKKLKAIIKEYVREALIEVLAEAKIESMIAKTIKEHTKKPKSLKESLGIPEQKYVPEKLKIVDEIKLKNDLLNKIAPTDDVWRSIYADTLKSDYSRPILEGNEIATGKEIPESVLEQAGFMRDYSVAAGLADDPAKTIKDDEMTALQEKRRQMLESKIRRG